MRPAWLAVPVLVVLCNPLSAQEAAGKPVPRVVQLDATADGYTRVLGGPPETVTMRSGQVVLAPGATVGEHSTEVYEEVVIVLSGSGEMRIAGGATFLLTPGSVAYCPPQTTHDVVNTGADPLRYLYVVARTP
ncbi:MAG TPA: cupin domain-containing protein [Gemmatimonadales bacterium]|nr:cupin domain-containing protein [Gemmatimonadales bacterium]